jgi:hypothetical protein
MDDEERSGLGRDIAAETQAETPRRAAWWSEWPIALVLANVAFSLLSVASGDLPRGVFWLAGSTALGGLLRLVLPTQRAGVLAVRRRALDAIILFGVTSLLLAFAFYSQVTQRW